MYGINNYHSMEKNILTSDLWKVAIYCRLSREDEGVHQSESIINQRDFLERYVNEQGWQLHGVYIDDGYSGTNFERPDFKRLIEDIDKGVNIIITKDLSRLGRDYITTGYYLEKFFPEKRVRYIAVNDGIDTFMKTAGNDISPFKSVINDLYARDISNKVRNAFDTKRKSGKFIGAFPPYGYKKDPKDKNKLIIDEETAPVVERIFHMYLNGYGPSKIAHLFNQEGVITPTKYKEGISNFSGNMKVDLWNHNTVRVILKNPTYMGSMRQNTHSKLNYKSNKLLSVPKEYWVIVEGTHEAIIDKVVFETVQNKIRLTSNTHYQGNGRTRLFSGLVFCGDCGAYMTPQAKNKTGVFMICSTYKRYTSVYCSRHAMPEYLLEKLVLEDLKQMAVKSIDSQKLASRINRKESNPSLQRISQEVLKLEKKLGEIDRINKTLYTDRVNGAITLEQYIELSEEFKKEKTLLKQRLDSLNKKLIELQGINSEKDNVEELAEELLRLKKLDRRILEKLIERIDIYENKKITIHYSFKNPLA